jgi:hypothetical protein
VPTLQRGWPLSATAVSPPGTALSPPITGLSPPENVDDNGMGMAGLLGVGEHEIHLAGDEIEYQRGR